MYSRALHGRDRTHSTPDRFEIDDEFPGALPPG